MTPSDDVIQAALDAGDEAAKPQRAAAPALVEDETETETFASKVQTLDPGWLSTPPSPREWLVTFRDSDGTGGARRHRRGLLARGELHLLAGEGGAGKGRFAVQVGLSIVAGPGAGASSFASKLSLDMHPVRDDEKVLFLVGEDDAHEMNTRAFGAAVVEGYSAEQKARIARSVRWRSFRGETFTIAQSTAHTDEVLPTAELAHLMVYLETEGPFALVVIDPWSRFSGVEENSNEKQHAAAAIVERIATAPGNPAVLLVAHTRKPEKGAGELTQHDVRGGSAIVNAARLVLAMAPSGGKAVHVDDGGRVIAVGSRDSPPAGVRCITEHDVVVSCVKNNLSAKGKNLRLSFHVDGGLHVESDVDARARRQRQWVAAPPIESSPAKNLKGTTRSRATELDDPDEVVR